MAYERNENDSVSQLESEYKVLRKPGLKRVRSSYTLSLPVTR